MPNSANAYLDYPQSADFAIKFHIIEKRLKIIPAYCCKTVPPPTIQEISLDQMVYNLV
jgi:hypothetical protein